VLRRYQDRSPGSRRGRLVTNALTHSATVVCGAISAGCAPTPR
jgi:hypothetical protein